MSIFTLTYYLKFFNQVSSSKHMNATQTAKRLHNFDLLRLTLVLIALLNHFMITHGKQINTEELTKTELAQLNSYNTEGIAQTSEENHISLAKANLATNKQTVMKFVLAVTRSSMPVLLIIFGFMIEYVYAGRWKLKGPKVILERMMNRAVVCYLAFFGILFIVFVQGQQSFRVLVGNMVFAFNGHSHANLFKYYALLIPITFLLMYIRFKYGWKWKLLLIVLLLTTAEWIKSNFGSLPGIFDHAGKLIFGLGNQLGPSIIHSVVLILFGALVANYHLKRSLSLQALVLFMLSAFSILAIAYEIHLLGYDQFLTSIGDYYTYRAKNSYVYFAYGIVAFLSFWAISWLLMFCFNNYLKEKISYYGGNTFIIFFYGNVIILLIPEMVSDTIIKIIVASFTMILSLAAVNAFDWVNKNFRFIDYINEKIGISVQGGVNLLSMPLKVKKRNGVKEMRF